MTIPPAQPQPPEPDRPAPPRTPTALERKILRQQKPARQTRPQHPALQWVRQHSTLVVVVLSLALGLVITVLNDDGTSPDGAKVGDCVQNRGTDSNPDVHIISCTDPKATYTVLDVRNDGVCMGSDVVAQYRESGNINLLLCLGNNTASPNNTSAG